MPLCKIGVLKKVNRSEWAAPTFLIPKKDKTVRFISGYWSGNLDNLIVTEQDFKDEFLHYVHRRFGPDALFPQNKTDGRM